MIKKVHVYYSKLVPISDTYKDIFNTISRNPDFKDLEIKELYIEDDEVNFEKYRIKEIPSMLLLDENNELIYKISGSISSDEVLSLLNINEENKNDFLKEIKNG